MHRHLLHVARGVLVVVVALGCASSARRPAFIPPTRPAEFSLAGIPWGISADSVTALVAPRGYNFNRADADGDLWFDGLLYRSPTRVYAFMSEKKLVKFRVVMVTADERTVSTYQSARAELIRQFGKPMDTIEEYKAPYAKGDSMSLAAIKDKKAVIRTEWLPTGSSISHVAIEIQNAPAVVVDYEGAGWDKESVRRRLARR